MSGFSDAERERIRSALIEAGRDRFETYGLQKTTVGELTDDVGIAQGSFYSFFDSKAELYVAVLDREADRVMEPLLTETLLAFDDPERAINEFLSGLFDVIETNGIARSLLANDEYEYLVRKLPAEPIEDRRIDSLERLIPVVEEWQQAGQLPDTDPEIIASAIRSVSFLAFHQEEIGEAYPPVRDCLIDAVARGLVQGNS